MKSYEIVGYSLDGEMHCPDCCVLESERSSPIFASQAEDTDYCSSCLRQWIDETEPSVRAYGPPSWVYLLGELP